MFLRFPQRFSQIFSLPASIKNDVQDRFNHLQERLSLAMNQTKNHLAYYSNQALHSQAMATTTSTIALSTLATLGSSSPLPELKTATAIATFALGRGLMAGIIDQGTPTKPLLVNALSAASVTGAMSYYRPDVYLTRLAYHYLLPPVVCLAVGSGALICNAVGKGIPLQEAKRRPIRLLLKGLDTIENLTMGSAQQENSPSLVKTTAQKVKQEVEDSLRGAALIFTKHCEGDLSLLKLSLISTEVILLSDLRAASTTPLDPLFWGAFLSSAFFSALVYSMQQIERR